MSDQLTIMTKWTPPVVDDPPHGCFIALLCLVPLHMEYLATQLKLWFTLKKGEKMKETLCYWKNSRYIYIYI